MNLHDIAREAGVSIATVSRVINNSPLVSDKTRQKVQTIIDKYSYTPNALARGLIQNSTKTIGVLTVDIRNSYFSTVVHSVERELTALGYNIFLCNTSGELEEIIRYIRVLLEKKVDGLIFVGSVYKEKKGNEHIVHASRKVPVVLLNNHIHADNIYCILCNDLQGTYQATKYLLEQGRRKLVYIHNSNTFSGLSKLKGFRKAMNEYGISRNNQNVICSFAKDIPLSEAVKTLFQKNETDGFVCSDDIHANTVINLLHQQKMKIPEQVSVIGYNNSQICQYTFPALSTVDSRMESLGIDGARLMDGLLKGNFPNTRVSFLEPYLLIRQS